MTTFDKVRATGFHADLIERTIVRLNGGVEPTNMLYHLETTFDDDSVFRHLDYLGLSDGRLLAFHLDEVSGGVRWVCNAIPLRSVDSVEVAQILAEEANPKMRARPLARIFWCRSFSLRTHPWTWKEWSVETRRASLTMVTPV